MGRYFDDHDSASAPKAVIINETLAKMAFGTEDPVGKEIVFTFNAQQKPRQVVGVLQDVHEGALDVEDKPAIYTPFAQDPSNIFAVVVRSAMGPRDTAGGYGDPFGCWPVRELHTSSPCVTFGRDEGAALRVVRRSPTSQELEGFLEQGCPALFTSWWATDARVR